MTSDSFTIFAELGTLADQIEPQEGPYWSAWAKFSHSCKQADYDAIVSEAKRLNALIEPMIRQIAKTTGNSADTLRQVYRPRDEISLWFSGTQSPAEFLRLVAKYRSFNEQYWSSQGWAGYTPRAR